MTVTTASIAATRQIAAVLTGAYGWHSVDGGMRAELRTAGGVASLGLDGTVVMFERRHETGYSLADLNLGAVNLSADPAAAAAQAVALLA